MKHIYIINSRGDKELFSSKKVFNSARRVGASKEAAKKIASLIEKQAYSGMKTSEIFKKVKELLFKEDLTSGLRFNLKEGMRKLGPSGFPFEKYIADIFSDLGYVVKLNQRIKGKCAVHEIDFLAEKNKSIIIGECKYRVHPGERIDLKVGLSNYAKLLDLKEGEYFKKYQENISSLIVTNAKFTGQIISYSECVGMELLGWKYPQEKGLEHIIETNKLYPITILPSFRKSLIDPFVFQKRMLVGDVLDMPVDQLADSMGVHRQKLIPLIKEAKTLLEVK